MTGVSGSASTLAGLVDILSRRLRDGESLGLSAILRTHPEHADELGRLFPRWGR